MHGHLMHECIVRHFKYFVQILQLPMANCMDTTNDDYSITLEDVLSFATGTSSIPPMGFIPNPQLNFHNESPYP